MSQPAPVPASDGPLRDLRRGLLRASAFYVPGLLVVQDQWVAHAVLGSCCLAWLPFTALEGWATRQRAGRPGALLAFAWALVALVAFGAVLQSEYVATLLAGASPRAALTSLQVSLRAQAWLTLLLVPISTALSAQLLARTLLDPDLRDPWGPVVRLCAGQVVAGAVAVGVLGVALDGLRTVLETFLPSLLFFACSTAILILIVFTVTRFTDGLEAQGWPPEAA